MKPTRTWILIADGARARIVLNTGPGHGIEAMDGLDFRSDNLPTRDIEADRPGRTFDSAGHGRHAKAPVEDAHDRREREFVVRLADYLDEQLRKKAYDRLILAADPTSLAQLRAAVSSNVRKVISAEIDKDLTHLPNDKLARHFEGVLAV